MLKYTLFTFSALFFTSTVANADWQYTKWGMTVDEVMRSSKLRAKTPTKVNIAANGHILHLLSAPYKANSFKFTAEFWFNKNNKRLNMVKLVLINLSQCNEITSNMRDIYGIPYYQNKTDYSIVTKWHDEINKNSILMSEYGNATCSIQYSSRNTPTKSGL